MIELNKIAFALISTELGKKKEVVENLTKISEVKKCYTLYGIYDIIVKVEAETTEALKDVISSKIRRIDHIRSILTMIVYS